MRSLISRYVGTVFTTYRLTFAGTEVEAEIRQKELRPCRLDVRPHRHGAGSEVHSKDVEHKFVFAAQIERQDFHIGAPLYSNVLSFTLCFS